MNLTPLHFYLWGRMKREVYKRKLDTSDEFRAYILDAAAHIKKQEDRLRRTKRGLRARAAKCTEDDGGIFEHLLRTIKDLSYLCDEYVI